MPITGCWEWRGENTLADKLDVEIEIKKYKFLTIKPGWMVLHLKNIDI